MDYGISKWFLMGSVWDPISILLAYWSLLQFLHYLKNRTGPPGPNNDFDTEKKLLLQILVILLAGANTLVSFFFIYYALHLGYNWICEVSSKIPEKSSGFFSWFTSSIAATREDKIAKMEADVAKILWYYMITKIIEFSDQVITLITQKRIAYSQVYHHMAMVSLSWYGLKFSPGGSTVIWASINSAYLSIAYTYQSISRSFPNLIQDWTPVKRLVTYAKLCQFGLVACHCITVILSYSCEYSKTSAIALLLFVVGLLAPFF